VNWIKTQFGPLVTLTIVLIGGLMAWSRLAACVEAVELRQADLRTIVETKADKSAVTREMDQLHAQLDRIERKIDQIVLSKQQ
jgi:Tfp pilus assembly protein PilO